MVLLGTTPNSVKTEKKKYFRSFNFFFFPFSRFKKRNKQKRASFCLVLSIHTIYIMHWTDKLNDQVAHSFIGKYFQLEHSGHRRERKGTKFLTELRAGLTIFFAMVIQQTNTPIFCFTHAIRLNKMTYRLILSLSMLLLFQKAVVRVFVTQLLLTLLVTTMPNICNVYMKSNLT